MMLYFSRRWRDGPSGADDVLRAQYQADGYIDGEAKEALSGIRLRRLQSIPVQRGPLVPRNWHNWKLSRSLVRIGKERWRLFQGSRDKCSIQGTVTQTTYGVLYRLSGSRLSARCTYLGKRDCHISELCGMCSMAPDLSWGSYLVFSTSDQYGR